MELLAQFIRTFLCGGVLCLIGQILIDKTSLTPAKILTMYVIAGVVLGAIGVYEPIAQWGGSGAAVRIWVQSGQRSQGGCGGQRLFGRHDWRTHGCCRRHHGRHLFRVADGAPFQSERKKMTKNSLYALK